MGSKYRVTNISKAPKFIAEIGKLLHPKDVAVANRLDELTREHPDLLVEEGDFTPDAVAKVTTDKQRYDDEDEDEEPAKGKTKPAETGPAALVDAKSVSRTVPLVAPSAAAAEDEGDGDDEDESLAKDELDDEVAKAEKPADDDEEAPAGFADRKTGPSSDPLVGR